MASINCILQCENGGYCSLFPHNSEPITHAPVDGSLHEICICPYGWSGLTCSEPSESMDVCHHYEGNHVCRNGGLCRPPNNNYDQDEGDREDDWRCDCKTADGVNQFAGAMCRDPATEYCSRDGSVYCTNGGTCWNNLMRVDVSIPRSGDCICPKEFGGPHCEFLKVLMDKSDDPHVVVTPKDARDGKGAVVDDGTGFGFGLSLALFVAVMAGMGVILQKQRRERYGDRSQLPPMSSADDNHLYESHADRATFPVVMNGYHGEAEGGDSDDSEEGEFVMQNIMLT